jgi:hypothetical protein
MVLENHRGKHLRLLSFRVYVWPFALILVMADLAAINAGARGRRASGQSAVAQQSTTQQASQNSAESAPKPDEIAVPLPKGKKLVLTDGSFQMVREYHREGERVRYYSLERSAWEELPASMVDWTATQKAELEEQAQEKAVDTQIKATEKAERFADLNVDTSFEVRPNVFLPDAAGFYAVDGNKVVPMQQESAELHLDKGRAFERIVTGMPIISAKQQMEIPGKQAKLRIHTGDVEFYFRTADQRDPHLKLIQAQIKDGKRELEIVSTNIAGQQSYKDREVSLLEWDAARGLYRFTVDQPLSPGEYGIIEATAAEGQSLYVWTFGVDLPGTGKTTDAADAKTTSKKKK